MEHFATIIKGYLKLSISHVCEIPWYAGMKNRFKDNNINLI